MADAWVGVAVAAHVARGVREGFAAFSHGSRAGAARPAPGARVACYAPRETVTGKRGWGLAFRRGRFRIAAADPAVTETSLRHG